MPEISEDGYGWPECRYDSKPEKVASETKRASSERPIVEASDMPIIIDHEQIAKFCLLALSDNGASFKKKDVTFLTDPYYKMIVREDSCTLSGTKKAILHWLDNAYPGKGLVVTFNEYQLQFCNRNTYDRTILDSLVISGATKEIAEDIINRMDAYNRPVRGVVAFGKAALARLGF